VVSWILTVTQQDPAYRNTVSVSQNLYAYKAVAALLFLTYVAAANFVYADIPWIFLGKFWREHTQGYFRWVRIRDRVMV